MMGWLILAGYAAGFVLALYPVTMAIKRHELERWPSITTKRIAPDDIGMAAMACMLWPVVLTVALAWKLSHRFWGDIELPDRKQPTHWWEDV